MLELVTWTDMLTPEGKSLATYIAEKVAEDSNCIDGCMRPDHKPIADYMQKLEGVWHYRRGPFVFLFVETSVNWINRLVALDEENRGNTDKRPVERYVCKEVYVVDPPDARIWATGQVYKNRPHPDLIIEGMIAQQTNDTEKLKEIVSKIENTPKEDIVVQSLEYNHETTQLYHITQAFSDEGKTFFIKGAWMPDIEEELRKMAKEIEEYETAELYNSYSEPQDAVNDNTLRWRGVVGPLELQALSDKWNQED